MPKGLKLLLARPQQQQEEASTNPLGVGGRSGGGRAPSTRKKEKGGKSGREETLGEWQQRMEGKLDDVSEKLERLLQNSPTTTPGSTSWRVSVYVCVVEAYIFPVPWFANRSPLSRVKCLPLSLCKSLPPAADMHNLHTGGQLERTWRWRRGRQGGRGLRRRHEPV